MEKAKLNFIKYSLQLPKEWLDKFTTVNDMAKEFLSYDLKIGSETPFNEQFMANGLKSQIMQISSITNISMSVFDQSLAKDNALENSYYEEFKSKEERYTNSRNFYSIVLTDGHHDVQALLIEYPDISKLAKGNKILLIPEYIISEGVILLGNKNFELLNADKMTQLLMSS